MLSDFGALNRSKAAESVVLLAVAVHHFAAMIHKTRYPETNSEPSGRFMRVKDDPHPLYGDSAHEAEGGRRPGADRFLTMPGKPRDWRQPTLFPELHLIMRRRTRSPEQQAQSVAEKPP